MESDGCATASAACPLAAKPQDSLRIQALGGLGLTLCREIVEAHRGRLSLANRVGGGALVTVWLP